MGRTKSRSLTSTSCKRTSSSSSLTVGANADPRSMMPGYPTSGSRFHCDNMTILTPRFSGKRSIRRAPLPRSKSALTVESTHGPFGMVQGKRANARSPAPAPVSPGTVVGHTDLPYLTGSRFIRSRLCDFDRVLVAISSLLFNSASTLPRNPNAGKPLTWPMAEHVSAGLSFLL